MKLIFKPWESKILKLKVFSLDPSKISDLQLADLEKLSGTGLVSVRVKGSAFEDIGQLKKMGFYLVENYLLYESETNNSRKIDAEVVAIKAIGQESVTSSQQLAKRSFQYDRFHRDPNIDKKLADSSRASWITNALKGRSFFVLGAFIKDKLVGFIDVNRKVEGAVIDLIAVNSNYRQRSIASQLINAAKKELKSRRIRKLLVGTQAENEPSIACYKKNNFKLIARFKTFHYYKS